MKNIKQKYYANIEIDTSEKDSILIWSKEKNDNQLVIIERENIKQLIDILNEQI